MQKRRCEPEKSGCGHSRKHGFVSKAGRKGGKRGEDELGQKTQRKE